MRMRRLKLVLLAALLFASACGRPAQEISATPGIAESVTLKGTTQVSEEARAKLRVPRTPSTEVLPPLPFGDTTLKVSSAVLEVSRDGANSYSAGGGATNVATSKLLTALPG